VLRGSNLYKKTRRPRGRKDLEIGCALCSWKFSLLEWLTFQVKNFSGGIRSQIGKGGKRLSGAIEMKTPLDRRKASDAAVHNKWNTARNNR